jgi:hypothetical protein
MALLATIGFSAGLIQSFDGTHSTCGCAAGLIFHFLSCSFFLLGMLTMYPVSHAAFHDTT